MKSKLVGLTVALCVTGVANVYGSGGSRGVLERESPVVERAGGLTRTVFKLQEDTLQAIEELRLQIAQASATSSMKNLIRFNTWTKVGPALWGIPQAAGLHALAERVIQQTIAKLPNQYEWDLSTQWQMWMSRNHYEELPYCVRVEGTRDGQYIERSWRGSYPQDAHTAPIIGTTEQLGATDFDLTNIDDGIDVSYLAIALGRNSVHEGYGVDKYRTDTEELGTIIENPAHTELKRARVIERFIHGSAGPLEIFARLVRYIAPNTRELTVDDDRNPDHEWGE
jgi:hypothetical protein